MKFENKITVLKFIIRKLSMSQFILDWCFIMFSHILNIYLLNIPPFNYAGMIIGTPVL